MLCFVYAFETKFSKATVSHMLNASVLARIVQSILDSLENGVSKEQYERSLKLISLFHLLNSVLQVPFGRLTHLFPKELSLLTLNRLWDQIITLANVGVIMAWYLRKKAQTQQVSKEFNQASKEGTLRNLPRVKLLG